MTARGRPAGFKVEKKSPVFNIFLAQIVDKMLALSSQIEIVDDAIASFILTVDEDASADEIVAVAQKISELPACAGRKNMILKSLAVLKAEKDRFEIVKLGVRKFGKVQEGLLSFKLKDKE